MPIKAREWTQREWTRPNVGIFREKGDFDNLTGWYPDLRRQKLHRAPDWDDHVTWPADFGNVEGAFYDQANQFYVFVGEKLSTDTLAVVWYDQDW